MQQVFHADKKMSSIPTCPVTSLHPPMKDYSSKCTLCHCISLFSHPHSSLHEPGNDNILVKSVLIMNREKTVAQIAPTWLSCAISPFSSLDEDALPLLISTIDVSLKWKFD